MNCFKKKQCENCKQWKQLSDYNFNVHQLACKKKINYSTPSVMSLWKESEYHYYIKVNLVDKILSWLLIY